MTIEGTTIHSTSTAIVACAAIGAAGAPDPPGDLEDGERREPAVADEDEEEITLLPVRQRHDEEKRQRGQEDEEHGPPAVTREAQPDAHRRERAHRQERQPCPERLEEHVAEIGRVSSREPRGVMEQDVGQ